MIIDYQGTIIGIDQIILRLFTIDARKAVITLKKVASLVTTIEATLFSLLKNKKTIMLNLPNVILILLTRSHLVIMDEDRYSEIPRLDLK